MTDTLELSPQAASVSAGRRFVASRLQDMGLDDLVETASLLTSELLTNSVLHARTAISVSLGQDADGRVEICVRDGSRFSPRRRRHAQDATTGRGIELLERLADSWDVSVDEGGKTIRFILTVGADPWAAFSAEDFADVVDL